MTFGTKEVARQGGNPIEFYTFERESAIWYMTSASEDITLSSILYKATAIIRSAVKDGSDVGRTILEFRLPIEHPLAQTIIEDTDSNTVRVTVAQKHADDSQVIIKWTGEVVSSGWEEDNAKIVAASIEGRLARQIPTAPFQRSCPFTLGDGRCRVDMDLYSWVAGISTISADKKTLTIETINGDYSHPILNPDVTIFQFGYIKKEGARRFIEKHEGPIIKLMTPILHLTPHETVCAYQGCNKLITMCRDNFDNTLNFGGIPNLPLQNPHFALE